MDKLKKLQQENLELQKKLREAEEALSAIQHGDVDAIVKVGNTGQELYSQENTISLRILESIGEAFVSVDKKWRYTYINDQAEKILNLKRADIIGKVLWDTFKSSKKTVTYTYAKKAMRSQEQISYETYNPFVKKWFSIVLYPTSNGLTIFFEDITDEKDAKAKLEQSELRFHTLTSLAPVGIFTTDVLGNCTYVNKKWQQLAGLELEEALGEGWLKALHPDDKERVSKEWLEFTKSNSRFKTEYRFVTPKGNVSWLEGSAVALKDKKNVIGYIGTISDITERKSTEEKLQNSERDFRNLADNIPNFAFMSDAKGGFYWFNSRWYEYTGTNFSQVKGWGWKSVHDKDILPKVMDKWTDSLKKGEAFEMVFPIKSKDGGYKPFLTRIIPLRDDKGKIVQWFGTSTDIAKQKELERQKDEFLGIASHELKTPVTSIKAYGQVLQKLFERKGDSKAVEQLAKMDFQINKLTNLIGDLLDVTKIQSGRLEFHEEQFNFNDLVSEVVGELQLTTDKHTIQTKLGKSTDIYGDKERIGQVLTNLITNAIKYSPKSSTIIVTTDVDPKQVTVSVRDFGVGIPKDKQDRVFEQFFRVSGPRESTFPGLGLGLFVSSEIVKRNGGRIWVESTEGKGSTFCFSLPRKRTKHKKKKISK